MKNTNAKGGGIGLMGVLFVVFVTLKLTGNIDWSWWWVSAPLWFVPVVILAFCGVGLLFITLNHLVSKAFNAIFGKSAK